jgi:hypothetical protein
MSRQDETRRRDGWYAFGAAVCVLVFFSFPFLLSRVEMPGPPPPPTTVPAPAWELKALEGKLHFKDAIAQSREFMGYYHTIELTPEQEAIKKQALSAMPAACCSDSTAYTCCCPCNLSKTVWGLSNYAIAQHGVDARQLSETVHTWMAFVNASGYTGNACHTGGCNGELSGGGCGGMQEDKLTV